VGSPNVSAYAVVSIPAATSNQADTRLVEEPGSWEAHAPSPGSAKPVRSNTFELCQAFVLGLDLAVEVVEGGLQGLLDDRMVEGHAQ
jgi:hypothetical protein